MSDVDHAATDFPELNFIVEHVGLPRIEDFCFMATQEPNVYAGLSVVIGGLMHARPKFFAKVMGELLFWVGEDKMTFGSDYGIWEPKWQIEGFVDWDYPSDEFSDYPRVNTATKKKILGLNAAKLYDIEVPAEFQLADQSRHAGAPRTTRSSSTSGGHGVSLATHRRRRRERGPRRARHGARPGAGRAGHRRSASSSRVPRPATGIAPVHLRLPTYFCAPNFAFLMVADAYDAVSGRRRRPAGRDRAGRPLRLRRRSTRAWRRGPGSSPRSTGWPPASSTSCGRDFLRKAVLAGTDRVCRPLLAAGRTAAGAGPS